MSTSATSGWNERASVIASLAGPPEKKVVLDATLRATKANQMGVLGFGGGTINGNNGYKWRPEFSAGVFVADNVLAKCPSKFEAKAGVPELAGGGAGR